LFWFVSVKRSSKRVVSFITTPFFSQWGFNFDLVNRSAKLTLRKSRKPWWRASYSVQDMNLVVLTKKLPIPFVGAKMGKHVPAGMQPHLQVRSLVLLR
jgi:hypothetical protein